MENGEYRIIWLLRDNPYAPSGKFSGVVDSNWQFCKNCESQIEACGFYDPTLGDFQNVKCPEADWVISTAKGQGFSAYKRLCMNRRIMYVDICDDHVA